MKLLYYAVFARKGRSFKSNNLKNVKKRKQIRYI